MVVMMMVMRLGKCRCRKRQHNAEQDELFHEAILASGRAQIR